jgi:hypothetical protein
VRAPSGTSVSLRNRLRKMLWWWRAPYAWKATGKLGNWRNRSSEHAVPLSNIQINVLRLLAAHRDPESYVAGATPLNQNTARYSGDIDIFHDREERVATAALHDVNVLEVAGYRVTWLRQLPLLYTVEVTQGDASTRLAWVVDNDYRFFPTMCDETFGYVLQPIDLVMNKVMAAAGRREVRDIVDLVMIHGTILPLGAVIGAAVEKSPGFTPEGLIAEIRRNAHYPTFHNVSHCAFCPVCQKRVCIPRTLQGIRPLFGAPVQMPLWEGHRRPS